MKTVQVEYVAMIREAAGRQRETLSTTAGTVGDVYDDLAGRYAFPWPKTSIRPAVNGRISAWHTPVEPDDSILFLPPSSGG